MTDTDRPAFADLMTALSLTFDAEVSDAKSEIYFRALADLAWEDIRHAGERAIQTCTFFPKPAELRALIVGHPEDIAERAWEQLGFAASQIGSYDSICIESPHTARALEVTFGSWIEFCSIALEPPMWAAKRKEFLAAYRVAVLDKAATSRTFVGLHDRGNVPLGYVSAPQAHWRLMADGRIDAERQVLSAAPEPRQLPPAPLSSTSSSLATTLTVIPKTMSDPPAVPSQAEWDARRAVLAQQARLIAADV